MVKKCVVFVYLCNLDLSIPCAPLEPVKKLTNKQTNKREKLKKETITKNKKTKQNKQTKRNKDVTEGRLLLIFLIDILIYILYLQICEFKREL